LLRVACNQCNKSAYTDNGDNPDSSLSCGCCPQQHDHAANANACPGAGMRHEGAACPQPDGGAQCLAVTGPGEPCPGGHCALGVPGCQVCRPVTITVFSLVTPAG
jgi:hypothetical protein